MLQNSSYAISGTFYTLLNNTDLYLSYFILSYVFLGHNDSVEWGLTVFDLTISCEGQKCTSTIQAIEQSWTRPFNLSTWILPIPPSCNCIKKYSTTSKKSLNPLWFPSCYYSRLLWKNIKNFSHFMGRCTTTTPFLWGCFRGKPCLVQVDIDPACRRVL